jgi:hypothetical protein
MIDVQPLGTREEPVQAEHGQPIDSAAARAVGAWASARGKTGWPKGLKPSTMGTRS